MKFAYIEKSEFEADVIADILSSENILFKTKEKSMYIPLMFSICELKNYNISFNTSYQKYLFVDKLIKDKLKNYKKLEKCYSLPSYDKYKIVENELDKALKDLEKAHQKLLNDLNKVPKETLLYKFAKWLKARI